MGRTVNPFAKAMLGASPRLPTILVSVVQVGVFVRSQRDAGSNPIRHHLIDS